MDLSTATGKDLEKIAEQFGIVRDPGVIYPSGAGVPAETDEELRRRIRSFALGGDGHVMDPNDILISPSGSIDFIPITIEIPGVKGKQKCECGAASIGYPEAGSWHASYCPLHKG